MCMLQSKKTLVTLAAISRGLHQMHPNTVNSAQSVILSLHAGSGVRFRPCFNVFCGHCINSIKTTACRSCTRHNCWCVCCKARRGARAVPGVLPPAPCPCPAPPQPAHVAAVQRASLDQPVGCCPHACLASSAACAYHLQCLPLRPQPVRLHHIPSLTPVKTWASLHAT